MIGELRLIVRKGRRRLMLEAAECCGQAIHLERESGGQETMMSSLLRFRAAWCDLGAVMLGDRGRS